MVEQFSPAENRPQPPLILGDEMKLWRGQPENWNWKPSGRDKAFLSLGFGVVFYVLALSYFLSPLQSSRAGRWGWLHEIFFGMFGANGDIVLYTSVGTAFIFFGALKFKATQ